MTYVITSLCLRDSGCVDVCPVECIVPGKPQDEWPLFYIDPETCIDCGACVPECPFDAIFPEDEVPTAYKAKGGELISQVWGAENGASLESLKLYIYYLRRKIERDPERPELILTSRGVGYRFASK